MDSKRTKYPPKTKELQGKQKISQRIDVSKQKISPSSKVLKTPNTVISDTETNQTSQTIESTTEKANKNIVYKKKINHNVMVKEMAKQKVLSPNKNNKKNLGHCSSSGNMLIRTNSKFLDRSGDKKSMNNINIQIDDNIQKKMDLSCINNLCNIENNQNLGNQNAKMPTNSKLTKFKSRCVLDQDQYLTPSCMLDNYKSRANYNLPNITTTNSNFNHIYFPTTTNSAANTSLLLDNYQNTYYYNNNTHLYNSQFPGHYQVPSFQGQTPQMKKFQSVFFYNNNLPNTQFQTLMSNFNGDDYSAKKPDTKTHEIFNIEDLLFLEEKLEDVLNSINHRSGIDHTFPELLNFYKSSSLIDKLENIFLVPCSKIAVHNAIQLLIYDIIICYHISFNESFNSNYKFFTQLLMMNHKSYLLICEYVSSKISRTEQENIWTVKLRKLLKTFSFHVELNNQDYVKFLTDNPSPDTRNQNLDKFIMEMNFYIFSISKQLKVFLCYSLDDALKDSFNEIFNLIAEESPQTLINFFKTKIYRIPNKNASINGQDASKFGLTQEVSYPYIKDELKKKFTLVVDLDETLISFTMQENSDKGIIKFRPGIDEFLLSVRKYYEVIVFTSATKQYADPIEDEIEKDHNKYFDYRLYRHHTIIVENDFVKDISRIGRPLDKTIIVDNMPQNFRLQKENGIWIKSFWGDDVRDNALYCLKDILIKIAMEFKDVRKGIAKYKQEILTKVSSSYDRE